MTMICINTELDHAEIMTDTFSQGAHGAIARPGVQPRAWPLRDIDAAVMFRGPVKAGGLPWVCTAAKLSLKVDDFDGLVDGMQDALRGIGCEGLCAYAVGYSPRHERMKAYVAWSGDDFAPQDISEEAHITPVPPGVQVSSVERRRREQLGEPPLPSGEPLTPPASADEWAALAKRIHRERACIPPSTGMKMMIGGPVTLTRLERGHIDQQTIHAFTTADFRAMVVGTLHPFGQVGPCECGSGRRFLDCCLRPFKNAPCLCESGRRFADCCLVGEGEAHRLIEDHPDLATLTSAADASTGSLTAKGRRQRPVRVRLRSEAQKCCLLVGV